MTFAEIAGFYEHARLRRPGREDDLTVHILTNCHRQVDYIYYSLSSHAAVRQSNRLCDK